MASKELVYYSSLARLRIPAAAAVVMGLFQLEEAVRVALRPENHYPFTPDPFTWSSVAVRFVLGLIMIGLVVYLFKNNHQKIVKITPRAVVCTQGPKTLAVGLEDMVIFWPRRGQRKNRTIGVGNGAKNFQVEEFFFPAFNDLLTRLKQIERVREQQKSNFVLDLKS